MTTTRSNIRKSDIRRPNMSAYFKARIDWHVHGMMARTQARKPEGVTFVKGDVTDHEIIVVMRDGTEFRWTGGLYSARKVNGCYAPLMPKPINKEIA